jgi:isopenicillin-N epimerase
MPVEFGSSLRDRWLLDPAVAYLNHGTVGSPPRRVLEHQRRLVDRIERHPARFMLRDLADPTASGKTSLMREAAAQVASFVGADGSDVMFVDNATAGINAVLRSFPFERGDEIVITALGYGGIARAAERAARTSGATLRTIALPGPGAPAEELVEAVARGISAATRVIVVDHLTSSTALVLPIAEIAAAVHDRGALVLVDGAHVPGNVSLDIASLGVDWYVANLHKWAWAPRSCGILWTSAAQQPHLFPTVTSWGLDNGLAAEFDLPGTRDPSAFLTAPFAIDLMREYGLEAVYAYNHGLAWWAAQHLADAWAVPFTTPESMIGAMATIPLPRHLGSTDRDAERLRASLELLDIEVPILVAPDGLAVRISAQIYCDRADVERLVDGVARCV